MKRFSGSHPLGTFLCPSQERKNEEKNNAAYSREFQAMLDGLDEEDSTEETSQVHGKKRRLSFTQVKALERIFEVDNKLEPEQKVKLAEELGLQPRQVAIWFQNRRARWKTKQMERDYLLLKADYEALKLNYDKHRQENDALNSQVKELKAKLGVKKTEENHSVRRNALFSKTESNFPEQSNFPPAKNCDQSESIIPNSELWDNRKLMEIKGLVDFRDGLSSDSDSSGVLNEDGNFNSQLLVQPLYPWMNSLQYTDSMVTVTRAYEQQQFGKMEESCDIFSVDQSPTLHWNYYGDDQRS